MALYGAAVSLAIRLPSTQNSTRWIALPEVAVAENRAVLLSVEFAAGAVRRDGRTGGRPASGATGRTTVHDALAPGDSTLPARSVERTSTVWLPMPSPDT